MPESKSAPKPEEAWHPARLIPTTGIGGAEEQEERATSSLLAVMHAVPSFGRALLALVGAPAGRISTFTEVYIKDLDNGTTSIPDGAVVVERGRSRWMALVEVKTDGRVLNKEQVERYLELARINDFDAVITLSNDITSSTSITSLNIDARKTRKVALRHLSWFQVTTEAVLQSRHQKVSDPDQAWLLRELIAYLEHEKSGAGGFADMGDLWVTVRDAARARTLNMNSKGAREVTRRWEQFAEYLSMVLEQELGRDVIVLWPKNVEPTDRLDRAVRRLVDDGCLTASIKVPDAAAPIEIEVNLRTREVTTSATLPAPKEGKATTRINWLLRQVREAPAMMRIEARYPNVKAPTSALLRDAVVDAKRLLYVPDPKRDPREFTVAWARPMGLKRGRLSGSFVGDTKEQVMDFYRSVVQSLRPWVAPAPKLATPTAVLAPEAIAEIPLSAASAVDEEP